VAECRRFSTCHETFAGEGRCPCIAEIRAKVGSVTVEADEREVRLYSEQGEVAASLLRVAGPHASIDGSGGLIDELSTWHRLPVAA
jgi:hypothetical protein